MANTQSTLDAIEQAEASRPDLPGEHVTALAAGLLLLMAAERGRPF